MPSPKSGTAGTAVTPAAPTAAKEAATANPGAVTDAQGNPLQPKAGQSDSAQVKPYKPPQTKEEKEKKKSWIEIALVGEDKNPIPGEPYQITLPDGTVAQGTLDEKGLARVDDIDPGTCQITFPGRDQDAWKKA